MSDIKPHENEDDTVPAEFEFNLSDALAASSVVQEWFRKAWRLSETAKCPDMNACYTLATKLDAVRVHFAKKQLQAAAKEERAKRRLAKALQEAKSKDERAKILERAKTKEEAERKTERAKEEGAEQLETARQYGQNFLHHFPAALEAMKAEIWRGHVLHRSVNEMWSKGLPNFEAEMDALVCAPLAELEKAARHMRAWIDSLEPVAPPHPVNYIEEAARKAWLSCGVQVPLTKKCAPMERFVHLALTAAGVEMKPGGISDRLRGRASRVGRRKKTGHKKQPYAGA